MILNLVDSREVPFMVSGQDFGDCFLLLRDNYVGSEDNVPPQLAFIGSGLINEKFIRIEFEMSSKKLVVKNDVCGFYVS